MPVLTMPLNGTAQHKTPHRMLSATLRELCRYLPSCSNLLVSDEECLELAIAAIGGQAEAEFTVGSFFDAAGYSARALEWYHRAADRDYLPAMLQLVALR